jgi:hypothetical protein
VPSPDQIQEARRVKGWEDMESKVTAGQGETKKGCPSVEAKWAGHRTDFNICFQIFSVIP